MTTISWTSAASADWETPGDWSANTNPGSLDTALLNASGTYDVTVSGAETIEISNLSVATGTLTLQGTLELLQNATIAAGATLDGGGPSPGAMLLGGTLVNNGLILADMPQASLNFENGTMTNNGTVLAAPGSVAFLAETDLTNLSGGVLTGGTYEAAGNGSAVEFAVNNPSDSEIDVDAATIILGGLGTTFLTYNPSFPGNHYEQIETTLSTIAANGVLEILAGRGYGTGTVAVNQGITASTGSGTAPLLDAGLIVLSGGAFAASTLTVSSTGTFSGSGTIEAPIILSGLVQADAGILLLAGGITDSGTLASTATGVLALSGTITGDITDDGNIQAQGGTLKISGDMTGQGGLIIQGDTSEVLELATTISNTVRFNGNFGTLEVDNPTSFTGNVVGFGGSDVIDLAGVVANGATLSGGTLELTENNVDVYALKLSIGTVPADAVPYIFSTNGDGAGGTDITMTSVGDGSTIDAYDYTFESGGIHWASKTITWSFADTPASLPNTPLFSSFISDGSDYANVVEQAFSRWAGIEGFNFVEVPDGADADIRVGFADLSPSPESGEIGLATYTGFGDLLQAGTVVQLEDPSQSPITTNPDVIGGYQYENYITTLYQVALHEIGHALGMGHSTDITADMYPSAGTDNEDVSQSDILGIQTLYAGIACYANGTKILTASGEVAVEELQVGDVLPSLISGRLRKIRWIGHRRLAPARHPNPEALHPIRIHAHALAPNQPHRDLLLSPDHAVYADGALIPIHTLVNGATILREAVDAITYWHIELDAHDIILAENLPAESYLDTGNRGSFANSEAPAAHPDFSRAVWAKKSCAPLHLEGALVAGLRARLIARAVELGHIQTTNPACMGLTPHGLVHAHPTASGWRLDLPAGHVTLLSRALVPAAYGESDPRRLGIPISAITLNGRSIPLDSPILTAGFHPFETNEEIVWRWTNGAAEMELPQPGLLEITQAFARKYWEGEGLCPSTPVKAEGP